MKQNKPTINLPGYVGPGLKQFTLISIPSIGVKVHSASRIEVFNKLQEYLIELTGKEDLHVEFEFTEGGYYGEEFTLKSTDIEVFYKLMKEKENK